MSPALLTLLTFGAVITAVAGVYSIVTGLYLRDRSRVSQRVDEEFRKRQRDRARKSLLVKDFNQLIAGAGAESIERLTPRKWFESLIDQSGLEVTPRKVLTIAAIAGLGLSAVGGLLRQSVAVGAWRP